MIDNPKFVVVCQNPRLHRSEWEVWERPFDHRRVRREDVFRRRVALFVREADALRYAEWRESEADDE